MNKVEKDPRLEEFARLIVQQFARGNLLLKLGRFSTEEDIAKRREKFSKIIF